MAIQITIIGLHQLGTSIGLALAERKDEITRTGNDREPDVARKAEKLGAVDRIQFNLPAAVRGADVVILALPFDEVRATIENIAPDLKPGTVLIDTSPVKEQVLAWAEEILTGQDQYFLSLTPSINPLYLHAAGEEAHADLFRNSLMLISSLPGTDESALTLTSTIVEILGAKPLFADAVEGDGILAASHLLPELVSAALINTTIDQPGWREARKMAGALYARVTESAMHREESHALGEMAQANAQNVARLLENVVSELLNLRDAIVDGDQPALQERLEHARAGRLNWQQERYEASWEPKSQNNAEKPGGGLFAGRLFGIRSKKGKR